MEPQRLPYKAYHMLLALHNNGVRCWATQVHDELYKTGFGFVWEQQGVGNVGQFLHEYKQRLSDCFRQDWHSHISSSTRFEVYKQFKSAVFLEIYLTDVNNKCLRDLLTRFRLGISDIKSHKLRYTACSGDVSLHCPLCGFHTEDEKHFLFHCPSLTDLRLKFIPSKYLIQSASFWSVGRLLSDRSNFVDTARFIYYSLKRRRELTTV